MSERKQQNAAGRDIPQTVIVPDADGDAEDGGRGAEELCAHLAQMGMTADRYEVEGKMAEGGMGAVYRAVDRGLKRTTVLKVIQPHVIRRPDLLDRFIEEARITGELEHPHIVPVHDLGALGPNRVYFSMKYIQGEALSDVLRQLRRGNPAYLQRYDLYSLLTLFRKVCDAVAFAHSRGIIHRDIKPPNIMVGEFGEVLLVDWGLARRLDDAQDNASSNLADERRAMADELVKGSAGMRTREGIIKGTPAYMSPEQARAATDEVGTCSDIYLLGATLYSIATLYPPHTGNDIYEMVRNAERGRFKPPQERAPERHLPEELCRIIMKAMALDPADRYQYVGELNEDLDALLAGRTVSVEKAFAAGEMLMTEGEQGDEAYVIVTGQVEVSKVIGDQPVKLVTLGPGNVVGEMALISKAPRSASVRALVDTQTVVITQELMERGLAKLPPWLAKATRAMVDRLREANASVHPLTGNDCSYHVLNQLRMIYLMWSQPRRDAAGNRCLALANDAVISEIANNLSLPRPRVARTVAALFEFGLIEAVGEDHLAVRNFDLLNHFTDYVRETLDIAGELPGSREATLYAAGDGGVAITLSDPEAGGGNDDLSCVADTEPGAVLGIPDLEALGARYVDMFRALHALPTTAPPEAPPPAPR